MIGVVLGNGPSRKAFNRNGDFVLGCNIPSDEFSVDATVICDEEIVWVLKNNLTLIKVPVIISNRVFEKMKELGIVDHFIIHHVFTPKDWYNTAHYAAEYLINFGCNEIHIWGCDSIFKNTVESNTSDYVKKQTTGDERFIRHWREVWKNIMDNKNVGFIVYKLENE